MDEETMKLGLLMEAAQAHQSLAEDQLRQLRSHAQDLDRIVRDQIRHTLVTELQVVSEEVARLVQSLRGLQRAAGLHSILWTVGITGTSGIVMIAMMGWFLPSPSRIDALRETRDRLAEQVASLEREGGRIELRRCGETDRLCVRIDRRAPIYGESADFMVVKGH